MTRAALVTTPPTLNPEDPPARRLQQLANYRIAVTRYGRPQHEILAAKVAESRERVRQARDQLERLRAEKAEHELALRAISTNSA